MLVLFLFSAMMRSTVNWWKEKVEKDEVD